MTTPRIVEGIGTLPQLADILRRIGAERPLLVTGKGSYAASGAAAVVDPIVGDAIRFSDFDVNPKLSDAMRGAALVRDADIDAVVAVGGGSVMDMAKLIKAIGTDPDRAHDLATGAIKMERDGPPLIAVPTTAGSGSEATHFAVVYIGTDKYSLAAPYLLPGDVILDGSLLGSATSYQKACNGLDALSQAIESAWAAGSTEDSRAHAFAAIEKLMRHLPAVVAQGADDDAFQDMILSANLAGRAINVSKTTAAHAWSYGFTSHHDVPHGHAVWLTLPEIVGIHGVAAHSGDGVTDPRGVDHVRTVMDRILPMLGIEDAAEAPDRLRAFLRGLQVETEMEAIGADTPDKRAFLSRQVNMQRMSNNPVAMDASQIARIFRL